MDKADNIRLEDINLSYTLLKGTWRKMPFQSVRIYGYVSNLGALWVANKEHIDPFYVNSPKPGKSFAFGFNINF